MLITAPDLSHSDLEIVDHVQTKVNAAYGVSIDWRQATEAGLVVLLLDGLDEVGTDRRSVILDRLRRFSAVHPAAHWIVTVRDAAALSAPTEAKLVELAPLTDNAIQQFVSSYLPGDEDIHPRLQNLFESQPEMRRLSRIPLFLTMLLATAGRTGALPQDRTDVIENHLSLLWDPARFKPSDGITTDPGLMRDIAQRAAFEALEKDEVGLTQRLLERMIPAGISSRVVANDLLKCGILRQPGPSRFEFPFPIVQEYAAAVSSRSAIASLASAERVSRSRTLGRLDAAAAVRAAAALSRCVLLATRITPLSTGRRSLCCSGISQPPPPRPRSAASRSAPAFAGSGKA